MPIITTDDLITNLYPEVIDEITRNDSTIAERAITAAIQETKQYLGRFDLIQLFGIDTEPPELEDEYLKSLVKDIACWHITRLSGTCIDNAAFRLAYMDALNALKRIRDEQTQPEGWQHKDSEIDGNTIDWNSNPRRSNFY